MITSRPLELLDLPMLQRALDQDSYEHASVPDYTRDGAFTKVYEDEEGPIGILRYTKTLRLVTVWCKNDDRVRNASSVIQAIEDSVALAKTHGYTEIVFNTESPTLARFCTRLGFQESKGQYVKQIS